MNTDPFGITYFLSSEVCELLYQNPDLKLANVVVSDPEEYNSSVKQTYSEFDLLPKYTPQVGISVEEFDKENQRNWLMPNEYKEFDIAEWVLNQCNNEDEIKRCGQELLLFQEKGTFDLLRYTKYLVDTFRQRSVGCRSRQQRSKFCVI